MRQSLQTSSEFVWNIIWIFTTYIFSRHKFDWLKDQVRVRYHKTIARCLDPMNVLFLKQGQMRYQAILILRAPE